MKKPTKLLLFFLTSALFLGILYWNNIEPPTPPPDPPVPIPGGYPTLYPVAPNPTAPPPPPP